MKEFCVLRRSKVTPARNYDVYYDKTIAFPGAKDYYRETRKAMCGGTEYNMRVNYDAMFSDVRPRCGMTIKKMGKPPERYEVWKANQEKVEGLPERPIEVRGTHRTLFYKSPTISFFPPTSVMMIHLQTTQVSSQTTLGGEGLYPQPRTIPLKSIMRRRKSSVVKAQSLNIVMVSKSTQTDYRDSEAQTLPWAHDFIFSGQDTEIFTLGWFKWDKNVPAGVHELTLIERARQKLAWENAFPKVRDKETETRRKLLVAMIETNETAFRESELDTIHKLRINLSKQKMKSAKEESNVKLQRRLERLRMAKKTENMEKMEYYRHQYLRTMRKLNLDHKKVSKKYSKRDIVTLHSDKTSELYAPQLRFGENPSRRHEVIDIQCRYLKRYRGFEILEQRVSRSPRQEDVHFDYVEASKSKKLGGMCPRAICYTEEGLERLHSDIKAIRLNQEEERAEEELSLRKPLPVPGPSTPVVSEGDDYQEDMYQASLFLAKTVKGRAVQTRFVSGFIETKEALSQTEELVPDD